VNDCEILDSHHHLWDTNELHYSLLETIDLLNRPFTAVDFEAEAEKSGISQSICVEAASAGADGRAETEWLLRQAEACDRIAALVPWAPLDRPELERYLDWLCSLAGKPIVGVRRSFEFEDSLFPKRPEVVDGARIAGARGLVVDLVLFCRSLGATIALVDACPETVFVLDHLGKPSIREGHREPWAGELRELAARANVACKLSGLTTEAERAKWSAADLRPYVEHALDCFGEERILFGSDWPVVNLAGGLSRWMTAVRELFTGVDRRALSGILAGNARRTYGLDRGRGQVVSGRERSRTVT
jgi:L-fuconolactonase